MEAERKLKLIWDFRGPQGKITAQHHAHHLEEYIESKSLSLKLFGHEELNEMHSIAYMVVYENEMPAVRDALKPHRGQLYTDE